MENLQEKLEQACEDIEGFSSWLDKNRRSRIFEYMLDGLKRDIIAADYDKQNCIVALVLQEPGNQVPHKQFYSGVEETAIFNGIQSRQVKIFRIGEDKYEFSYGAENRMSGILGPAVAVDIRLKGFSIREEISPDIIPFELSGIDSAGKIRKEVFYYFPKSYPDEC